MERMAEAMDGGAGNRGAAPCGVQSRLPEGHSGSRTWRGYRTTGAEEDPEEEDDPVSRSLAREG